MFADLPMAPTPQLLPDLSSALDGSRLHSRRRKKRRKNLRAQGAALEGFLEARR